MPQVAYTQVGQVQVNSAKVDEAPVAEEAVEETEGYNQDHRSQRTPLHDCACRQ